MKILTVNQLTKNYAGEVPVEVLKKMNFTVETGEFVAIMGPSGSGKTTLLNCLGTLDQPTSGTILLNDENPATYDKEKLATFRRQQLGFIFQNYNLLSPLTVAENIMLPLTLDHGNLTEMESRTRELMAELGIEKLANKRVHELSGGECQRVAIARALIHDPSLILADEPTGNLDSKAAGDVMEILQQLNQTKKVTTLMVTHDPISASYAKRVIFIKDGELFNEVYLGESREAFYQEILTVLSHLGGGRHEFSTTHLA
ncbi:ABC transporter ATP-binding protein [Enterococcus timonensis]|uniref:ABC transporter ATP-binding protein n=1 Tax=Enterococcus timonensis TaxID=1852364 RepID=UPI0008DA0BDD|nr:ABC transporter ATP-binding protein [Enterococcus timonensis]